MAKERIYYIDNLRIFLICLVVLHHLAITYGAPGGWFYNESNAEVPEILPYAMFTSTNQAFFMGMFFFISAYFITPSLKRKGSQRFIKDRLIRLGIPLLLFYFFLFPLTVFIVNKHIHNEEITLANYIFNEHIFGFGPMWFVEALLIFTFLYLLFRMFQKSASDPKPIKFPGIRKIVAFMLFLGLGQFIIRIWLPVGWAMPFTQFQLPHFLQYICLFILGIVAYKNNWMDQISAKKGWNWFIAVQLIIFIVFPTLFILGGVIEHGTDDFMGGFNWKCFSYAIYEQIVGIGMILALFGIFKSKFNWQNNFLSILSGSAYAVFVIHATILVGISALFLDFNIPQLLKFVVLAPISLILSFGLAFLIKQIPGLRKIF